MRGRLLNIAIEKFYIRSRIQWSGLERFLLNLGIKNDILGKIRTRAAPRIASNGRELKILSTNKLIEAPLRPPYSVLPNNLN